MFQSNAAYHLWCSSKGLRFHLTFKQSTRNLGGIMKTVFCLLFLLHGVSCSDKELLNVLESFQNINERDCVLMIHTKVSMNEYPIDIFQENGFQTVMLDTFEKLDTHKVISWPIINCYDLLFCKGGLRRHLIC